MKTTTPDAAEWLSDLFRSQTEMMQSFLAGGFASAQATPPAALVPASTDAVDKTQGAALPLPWQEMTRSLAAMQQDYFKQVSSWWTPAVTAAVKSDEGHAGSSQGAAPNGARSAMVQPVVQDKRFASEPWRGDPRIEMATRSYLNYASMLREAIDSSPLDQKLKSQWGFAARQLVDALSPANFLATNPEAMQLVVESGGQSLVKGMNLLVQDLVKGRITMTDEGAFELGRNIAVTAGDVIFENEVMQLIRYTPVTPQVHKLPLLMVPPCINKYYILDMQPDNSLVGFALSQGHATYMVSWRNATVEMAHLGWDDYLEQGVKAAIDVVLRSTGAEQVNGLGFCLGGTLLACQAAIERAQGHDRISSLSLLTTMLDFVDTGELGVLVNEQSVAHKEALIGKSGVMRGAELALTFSSLRANDLIWPYVVNGYLKGKAPPAFDLLYWNSDATNLPGPMYCWYVRNTYLENKLREPGATVQCGEPLDLSKLDMPVYLYASREDHIVPWKTAYATAPLLSGDSTFVLGASGHVAGVINPASKNKRNHWTGPPPADLDADEWLARAERVEGSWWTDWAAWMSDLAGPMIAASRLSPRGAWRSIEPAPGRYIKEKAE
ncbi:class I poly(R)-hydroxyalkanoic acid synthase [soil metagenome]